MADVEIEDGFIAPDMLLFGKDLGRWVISEIAQWQASSPRTLQALGGTLGFSDLGACREFLRANIAGDPKHLPEEPEVKWPAFLGTADGDYIEKVLQSRHPEAIRTQTKQKLNLLGLLTVEGSADILGPNYVIDLKSRDELVTVRREGPTLKEKIQISGYLVAAIQGDQIPEDSTGWLIYYDRSGADKTTHEWGVTLEQAMQYLEVATKRLRDVAAALETGVSQSYLRDEPESWCRNVKCWFYHACWDGYTPTGAIDHPDQVADVHRFVEARQEEKDAIAFRKGAREKLIGVQGQTEDGWAVRWLTASTPSGGETSRLDVYQVKKAKPDATD